MFAIFALVFIILNVSSAQVIPYTSINAQGAIGVPGYQVNAGLPVNGIAANKIANERIINGLETAALANNAGNSLVSNNFVPNNFVPNNFVQNNLVPNNVVANDAGLNLAALASNSLASLNGNVATFDLGGDSHAFTITSGSPGSQGFGIQVQADGLEVGGTVSVNGQIPIYGTVSVNGNVPTDGTAAVNYNCGKLDPAVV